MDSAVQLALMTKAKKVFGAGNTFLSFPVSPLPHTKRELDFFVQDDADALRQSLLNQQAFSTLVNLIPSGDAWLPTETRFLWEFYEEVLKADYASSNRTPLEEEIYQMSLAYLRVAGEGGAWEDSASVKAYRQHKDAFLLSQQKYLAAKSTAESVTDPAERQRWRDVDEPAQRAELDALQARWMIMGHKNEVETAQSRVELLGARSPIQTWAEWSSRFNRDIDTSTGSEPGALTVFPSTFSPLNALDEGAWQPFKLSEQEVKDLLNEAPAELRARFAADSEASAVKSLTFEFSSATILRPWFVSEAFRARFWRFADASRIISDGGTPPKGACPAYVTAIVFARRVTVEEKRAEPGQPGIQVFEGFHFNVGVRDHRDVTVRDHRDVTVRDHRDVTVRDHRDRKRFTRTLPEALIARRSRLAGAMLPRTVNMRMAKLAMMRPDVVSDAVASPLIAQKVFSSQLIHLQASSFTRLPELSAQPNPAVTLPHPKVQDDTIYILAFICKALPKSPDPDLTLQW